MSVTPEEVKYIADLARLQFDEKDVENLAGDMNQILDYMEKLGELDTSEVEPLEHVVELEFRYRSDETEKPVDHEEALKNAPDADSDYFRVPRVIE